MITFDRLLKRLRKELFRRSKSLKQRVSGKQSANKNIIFVTGCQRSGTSMTYKIFDRDPCAQVFDEISILSNKDSIEGLRLNSLESVSDHFSRSPASLVVAKPLVESQRILQLLDYFPNSTALWMYRNYNDVVSSSLKRFGTDIGFNDISPILKRENTNWRMEGLSDETAQLITNHADSANPADAAALFWYARNSLYFQQDLTRDSRVFLCKYENLVTNPAEQIAEIYRKFELGQPGTQLLEGISARSIGKGADVSLSPEVRNICESLLRELNQACESQSLEAQQTICSDNNDPSFIEERSIG